MTDWFRATSGEYWHADASRLRTLMMDWVERFTGYHNFWDHPYARRVGWHPAETFVRKLSRAALHIRIYQRRFRIQQLLRQRRISQI